MQKKNKNIVYLSSIVIVIVITAIIFSGKGSVMSMDEKRENFINLKQDIQGELLTQGNYACCLKTPCTYCIEKSPKHGEGASCTCLEDIVKGNHPCGECIGEILEGHGNPYLKEYFAVAIAEEVGEQHLDTLNKIIEEKYPA